MSTVQVAAAPCLAGITCQILTEGIQLSTTAAALTSGTVPEMTSSSSSSSEDGGGGGESPIPPEAQLMLEAAIMIKKIILPTIIVLGTVGNVLVLLIQRHQTSAMSVYLAGLAVSDTIYLWLPVAPFTMLEAWGVAQSLTSDMIVWVFQADASDASKNLTTPENLLDRSNVTSGANLSNEISGLDRDLQAGTTMAALGVSGSWRYKDMAQVIILEVICKLRVWTAYATMQISAWVLVSMTLHRCLTVLFPHSLRQVLNRTGAKVCVIFIFLFFSCLNAHTLYGHTLIGDGSPVTASRDCYFSYLNEDYRKFFTNVWTWLDIMMCALVPFSFLIATNIVLVTKVGQSVSEAKRVLSTGNPDDKHFSSRGRKMNSMTLTLITISVAFVLMTSPICVFMIAEKFMDTVGSDVTTIVAHDLGFIACCIFSHANCGINFYLYCLTGSKYRQDFFRLIGCDKAKDKGEKAAAPSSASSVTTLASVNSRQ